MLFIHMKSRNLPSLSSTALRYLCIAALLFLGGVAFGISSTLLPLTAQSSHSAAKPAASPGSRTIIISARYSDGSPAEISASDLKIKLDGKEASVTSARRVAGIPVFYWLLVDTSSSERPFLPQEREEAALLLSQIIQPSRDYGNLVGFDQRAYLDAEGSDPQALLKAMAGESARGSSSLFDAVFSCADRVVDLRKDIRIMFIFSDGSDNSSRVTRDDALRVLLREKIHVYAIGHPQATSQGLWPSSKGGDNLKSFAETTGGNAYFPKKNSDFQKALADISGDLQGLVLVTFTPGPLKSPGPLHKFEINCKKHGVVISAPRQYFLPN